MHQLGANLAVDVADRISFGLGEQGCAVALAPKNALYFYSGNNHSRPSTSQKKGKALWKQQQQQDPRAAIPFLLEKAAWTWDGWS